MPSSLIYESARSKVFLAENELGERVIHKILNSDFPTPKDVAQFYNEQNITQDIGIEGVRKVIAALKENNKHALHLEWFDGKTFAEVFRNKKEDILDFLTIAIEIVKVLGEVHQKGVIHQDISPHNVLVNLQQRKINLIDFGISTRFQTKHIDLSHPRNLQGTLAFSSPEQTGRMNRSIDYRTDLYSLGATFFYILTGRPPFESEDTMELVHAHIAKSPPRIVDLNPTVPEQVSRIINKLLEKNAENRYQSAYGLQHDLALCLKSLRESHEMKEFPLGQQDFSGHFQIHQKLYGRDKEIQLILDRFESCAQGSRQLLLLSGYSGTGKTALVHEVHRPITLKKGYYSEWKFDQFNKSTPYSAFLRIFENLIDLFLLENEDTLNRLAQDIRAAVGDEGKVLTDLFPNLERLIGKQPDIPSLGGEESQRRFNYLMQKFFRALCTADHPIVFFIDDLQWADASSLQLLENLLGLQNGGYFLCLGAYRDNETPPGHPLIAAITHMEQSGILVETIKLGNLHKGDINQMLADSMDRDARDPAVWDLTDLVVRKTAGNAFFTSQFLMSIADTELLRYDVNLREWTWSLDQIKAENITDNVVELMAEKILRLPKDTQEVLKYAACLGNTVDVVILSVVSDSDPREDQMKLEPAIREGLIFKINDRQLKFGHDRIQQAIYSLLDEESKTRLHYQIGRLLLDRSNPEQEEIHLFDIVNHFNSAESIFRSESPAAILELSRFNLRAALRSKLNSAFDVAMDYLHQAKALLPEDPWVKEYSLTYSIFKELNEISYLCAQYTLTDQYFDEIIQHAHSDLDKIKAYQVKIKAFQAQNELTPAVETGLEALALLGVRMPRKPTKLDVMLSLAKNEWQLRNQDMARIIAMPPMTDPRAIEAMHIFSSVASSSYWSEPNLIPIVAYKMIWMSMKHGRHILSAFAFTGYGIIMCGILGAMRKGYRYGEIGLKILELENSKEWTAQIEDPMYGLILHWNKHVGESLKPLRDSFYIGLETGENEFACVNASLYCIHSFLSGRPLEGLEKEAGVFSQTFAQLKQETQFKYNEIYRQAMLCLMGEADDPKRLVGRAYDAEVQLSLHQQNKDLSGTFFIYFNQMLLAYLFGDPIEATRYANMAYKLIDSVLAKFEIPNLYFYRSLAALAILQQPDAKDRSTLKKIARQGLRKLTYYAKYAPENYQHKCILIKSQIALVDRNFNGARLLFDQAIREAEEQGFIHEEALAYELAGMAYHEHGYVELAKYYLNYSFNLYREWGANAKLDHLLRNFPKYFTAVSGMKNESTSIQTSYTSTFSLENEALDMKSLLKASTSISSEVELPQLIRKLMVVLTENAGAQKGVLIMQTEGQLFVEAVYDANDGTTELLRHIPLEEHEEVPSSLIKYVQRSGKDLVINTYGSFSGGDRDTYYHQTKPESSLGLPINNQGKFLGVIYLENRLTRNAFTSERIDFLAMLSSQIAVSLENALLYQSLEQKVAERTEELAREKQVSDDLLFNILPREVAEELKITGTTQPRHYEAVTVLFTDFVGFTRTAQTMTAEELVSNIDRYFRKFDEIIAQHKLEKIKTIGDAYMCAGGLPIPNTTHPLDVIHAAREIIRYTRESRNEHPGMAHLDIRIGVHTGPLVAGVVGSRKFAYDIWGNTVNQASRLESSSEPGQINISETTYSLIKDSINCTYRGKLNLKGIGEVPMYFVDQ